MENETQPNVPPATPSAQIPVSPSKSWLKILLFILIELVIIAGSVFVGIQIGKRQIPTQTAVNSTDLSVTPSPTTNPTANWKTYENNQYGFTFKYPLTFTFKDNTGSGGDLANVPWKISLTGPNSIISSSIQKRQCNKNTGLVETPVTVANKTGIRFVQEDQMDGKLFSIDKIEVQLENNLCFTIEKYVSDKEASLNQTENVPILKEMTAQDKNIFETIISTINFSK